MKGYAAVEVFSDYEMLMYERARVMVEAMPDDGRSCHQVAWEVGVVLGLPVVRGWYGAMEHSWLMLVGGNLLDVYAPGRYPPMQLVHASAPVLPEGMSYTVARARLLPWGVRRG